MTARLPDWEQRLSDYIADNSDAVFQWGVLDCALFSCGAVQAIRGDDPAIDFRGKYSTAAGSARALKRYGEGSLEATFDARFEQKPVGYLGRGDLVWDGEAVGVCMGAHALFVGEKDGIDGIYSTPRSQWVKGWAV